MIVLLAGSISSTTYNWKPAESTENGNDYLLMIAQKDKVAYSAPIVIGDAPEPIRNSVAPTASAIQTNEALATESSTPTTAHTPSTGLAAATSTSIDGFNPTPTSSWDASTKEDVSLTLSDKIAIGIGVPIALLVLGTIGYWRAAKFFIHRKITGEPRLPMYGVSKGSVPTIVVGSGLMRQGGRQSSRATSLWGASSGGRRTRDPSPLPSTGREPSLIITPPGEVALKPESSAPRRNRASSGLRQSWKRG